MSSKSIGNPRYKHLNHSEKPVLTAKQQKAGDVSNKNPFWYPDLKLVIYAKNKKGADNTAEIIRQQR